MKGPVMLCAVFVLCVLCVCAQNKPNVLLLFPDQWRWDWRGSTPAGLELKTPVFDDVSSKGTIYHSAYVASPLCAPSRACLALGREFDTQQVPSNLFDVPNGIPTFYRTLRDSAGYHVMITGKDDLTKHSGYARDGSHRAIELGFSAWQGRTGGKDGTMRAKSGPYPDFLNNRTVLLSNGSTVNALAAHDECMPLSQFNPNPTRTWLACCETPNEGTCGKPSPLTDDLYEDNWVATEGLEMLRKRPAGQPW
jgi:hypothetical protein